MRRATLAVTVLVSVAACGRAGFAHNDAVPPVDAAPPDATVTGPCAGTTLYDDGFDDMMPGPVFQVTTTADLTVVEANSRVEIDYMSTVAANHYAGYRTNAAYPAEGICAQVEIGTVGSGFQGAYFKMYSPSKVIEFFETGGEVITFRTQVDKEIQFSDEVAFNPTAMRFWRFRVVGGVTHWDTSADGVTYVERDALPEFFAGVSGLLELGSGSDVVITDGTPVSFRGALAFQTGP